MSAARESSGVGANSIVAGAQFVAQHAHEAEFFLRRRDALVGGAGDAAGEERVIRGLDLVAVAPARRIDERGAATRRLFVWIEHGQACLIREESLCRGLVEVREEAGERPAARLQLPATRLLRQRRGVLLVLVGA